MKNILDKSKLGYLKKIRRIKELVNEIKFDIFYVYYVSSYGLLGVLINYYLYIILVWGFDVYDFLIKLFIYKYIIKRNLKKVDYILLISNVMKFEIEKYINKNIEVIFFGVDIKKFVFNKIEKDEIVIGIIKMLEEKYGI